MKHLYPIILILFSCSTDPENNYFPFYTCGDGIDGGQPTCVSINQQIDSESIFDETTKRIWYFSLSECLSPYIASDDTTSRPEPDVINKVCNCTGYSDTTCVDI